MQSIDLNGRKILVTGSTRGIGKAIASALVRYGAIVGIHGRQIEIARKVASELPGGSAVPISCDLSNPDNAASLISGFIEQTGGIDGLVNNAGSGKAMPFRAVTLDNWRKTAGLNLESAVMTCREAYVAMRKAGKGSIVNVASVSAHGPGKWMGADYAASKSGLVSLTKSLAFEAGRFGIRVNAVSPGMVNTDMTAVLTDDMKNALNIPLNRLAEPSEIAEPVAWLLSDESSYITGEVIHINGGLLM